MRWIALGLGLMVLTGCTSPADLMKGAPEVSVTTKKDPRSYALCVHPLWQEVRPQAAVAETLSGYRLTISAEATGQTDEVLDVKRNASGGSTVNLYQRASWASIGRSGISDAVRRCL